MGMGGLNEDVIRRYIHTHTHTHIHTHTHTHTHTCTHTHTHTHLMHGHIHGARRTHKVLHALHELQVFGVGVRDPVLERVVVDRRHVPVCGGVCG